MSAFTEPTTRIGRVETGRVDNSRNALAPSLQAADEIMGEPRRIPTPARRALLALGGKKRILGKNPLNVKSA